eukprot:Sdes_comp9817_c0_seq1m1350
MQKISFQSGCDFSLQEFFGASVEDFFRRATLLHKIEYKVSVSWGEIDIKYVFKVRSDSIAVNMMDFEEALETTIFSHMLMFRMSRIEPLVLPTIRQFSKRVSWASSSW